MSEQSPLESTSHQSSTSPSWRAWIEPWYAVYALLGAVSAGLLPILIPLFVHQQGTAAEVGLVMAALNASGLLAPLWSWLADRYRWHRQIIAGGMALTAIGTTIFMFVTNAVLWVVIALLLNLGAIAAATIANLLIIERFPRTEWDERLGWLQTAYGGGQVFGLLITAFLGQANLRMGFGITALCCFIGMGIAWRFVRTPSAARPTIPLLRHHPKHTDGMFSSPYQLLHHLNPTLICNRNGILTTPLSVWLGVWLLAASGAGSFFALYPIVMQQIFSIAPSIAAGGFAVAAALGLLLYAPAGDLMHRIGPLAVVRYALIVRAGACALLWLIGNVSVGFVPVITIFIIIVLSWSFISVSATDLTALLSPVEGGESIGLFNAISALANIIGASLGGWIAVQFGYPAVIAWAALGVACGAAGTYILRPPPQAAS
jgi:MFS family permease